MGKMPVVGLVGLLWAGIALTGCESCKNCRNNGKFAPSPAFQTRNSATNTPNGTLAANGDTRSGVPVGASAIKGTDTASPTGPTGFGTGIQPTAGAGASGPGVDPVNPASNLPTSPTTQNALRAPEPTMSSRSNFDSIRGEEPSGMPAMPTSRNSSTSDSGRFTVPPTPVVRTPGSASSDVSLGGNGQPLPPLSQGLGRNLPAGVSPQPPAMPADSMTSTGRLSDAGGRMSEAGGMPSPAPAMPPPPGATSLPSPSPKGAK